jgi:16S rRNA (guanine527-N7)-methyltransferase
MNLTDSFITNSLNMYGFTSTARQCALIRDYVALLLRWNKQISLTRVTDPEEILRFHFGESLYALTTGIVGDGRLADVGSGAGFPGVPLAIANPVLKVTLLEPNLKKSVFLSEVVRELHLCNVEVVRARMEEFGSTPLDYVTSRAVGQFGEFMKFSDRVLVPAGRAVLWIALEDSEKLLSEHPEWKWSGPQLIPASERRYLVYAIRK